MLNEFRYALRTLARAPVFAACAVLALALGIGANTAVFSVVYAVLLKPLPYTQPWQLVQLSERNVADGVDEHVVSAGTFVDWRARSQALSGVGVYAPLFNGETVWDIGGRPQIVKAAGVSPGLFDVLGVRPMVGGTFRGEADTPPAGALGQFVISYGLWRRAFGAAPDVVGRHVMLEGRLPREIVGVMPPGFDFPDGADAWTSIPLSRVTTRERRARSFAVVGRLKPGVTLETLRHDLDGISAQLATEAPASNAGWTPVAEPLRRSGRSSARLALLILMGAVGGILLIACANVANLLLARATARRRETAVRIALGAGAWRIFRQSIVEAGTLCLLGTAAGLIVGGWMTRALIRLAPPEISQSAVVGMNMPMAFVSALLCAVCAVAIGVVPAIYAVRASGIVRADGARLTNAGASRVRRSLIATEVAVVVTLLTGALLLGRTFVNLRHVDLGFDSRGVLEVETRWPVGHILQAAPGTRPWPRVQRAVDGLVRTVEAVPGVEAAGMMSEVPLAGDPFNGTVWRADAPGAHGLAPPSSGRDRWKADLLVVTAGYFPAMNITVVRGRNFTAADRFGDELLAGSTPPSIGAAIVNASFAARLFPDQDPVGRLIVVDDDRTFGAVRSIVGVVSDARGRAVSEAPVPAVFIPHGQHPDMIRPSLVIRSSLPFDAISTVVRDRLAAYDPQLLVLRMRPMDDIVSGALSRPRFNLVLMLAFAGVALLLAAVGIYGVVSFLVSERTREIGIRMALGARGPDVLRLVLGDGLAPVAIGAAGGLAASAVAARALRTLLYGVTPLDPVSLAVAPIVLAGVALMACVFPARRAVAVDPLVALRDE